MPSKIQFYPEISNENFEKILYYKKEFNDNIIKPGAKDYDELCKKNRKEFSLLPQQKFVKNFLSINSPYNGILMFWNVGQGKTCGAVSIAENFAQVLQKSGGKKIIVLLNEHIQQNFENEIYDPNKDAQCTGDIYSSIAKQKFLTKKQKEIEARRFIRSRYSFMGTLKFANNVKKKIKTEEGKEWDGKLESLTDDMKSQIKKYYRGMVIIIDEAHHIKSEGNKEEKTIVPPILMAVMQFGVDNKLVLMTATIMTNSASEIIYLINLLRLNDKKSPLDVNMIFDKHDNLIEGGEQILRDGIKGYVSYIGDNRYSFPTKIYPADTYVIKRTYDIEHNPLNKNDQMKYIKLMECPMASHQLECYNMVAKKTIYDKQKGGGDEEEYTKSSTVESILKNQAQSTVVGAKTRTDLTYISNIVYKDKKGNYVYTSRGISDFDNGSGGLVRVVKKNKFTNETRTMYEYQKHMISGYGTKNERPFLDEDEIWKYSSKMAKMLEIVKKSRGIIFIYSWFIDMGALSLALMFEQNGYLPYGGKNLLNYNPKLAKRRIPRCYLCDKEPGDKIHDESSKHPDHHIWKQARYVVFTGTIDRENKDKIIKNVIKSPENVNGSEIKIIIGSQVISEGIDFFNIRQIHIFEPWYNMSRMQQTIGRGYRHCSHLMLPPEQRNVEIFLYVASQPKKLANGKKNIEYDTESINERDYRIAEDKDIKIKRVERIVKESSVDCNFNLENNIINDNRKITTISARGQKYTLPIKDDPYTRECDYMDSCEYKCNWMPSSSSKEKINKDTYTIEHESSNLYKIKNIIKRLFKIANIYTLSDIYSEVHSEMEIEDIYIYYVLIQMLTNKEQVQDKYNRLGYIINRGHYYVYQPNELLDEQMPMNYRELPITIKHPSIKITDVMYEEEPSSSQTRQPKLKKGAIFAYTEKEIKRIKKLLTKNKLKISNTLVEEMVYSKLSDQEAIEFIKYLVENKIKNKYFAINIVKKFEGMWYGTDTYEKYQDGEWEKYGKEEMRKIDLLKPRRRSSSHVPNYAQIVGQVAKDKDKYVFKIIDRSKYTKALTQEMKLSKRSFIKGQTCIFYKKHDFEVIFEKLGIKLAYTGEVKSDICNVLEYVLRLNDKQKLGGKKHFIYKDEHIIYKE